MVHLVDIVLFYYVISISQLRSLLVIYTFIVSIRGEHKFIFIRFSVEAVSHYVYIYIYSFIYLMYISTYILCILNPC